MGDGRHPSGARGWGKPNPRGEGSAPRGVLSCNPLHGAMAMRILMIGGTRFLGRAFVEAALAAGHDVTLFHRGRSPLPPFAREVEHLTGDRDGGLAVLDGRRWDVAFDTCGYVPRIVGASARALADRIEHYTFVSTVSVYSDSATPGADETCATGTIADETVEEITGETYGPLKVLCERAAEAAMPGRVLHVRAGLIVGPHDPTDRFTYWIRAARSGRRFLAAEPRTGPLQVIDARDIAAFVVRMAEQRRAGTYDTIGATHSWETVLAEACRAAGAGASPAWAPEAWLLERGVAPWSDLPLWLPSEGEGAGLWRRNGSKAFAAGLAPRPIAETVRDLVAWDAARENAPLKAGMPPEREAELLAALG